MRKVSDLTRVVTSIFIWSIVQISVAQETLANANGSTATPAESADVAIRIGWQPNSPQEVADIVAHAYGIMENFNALAVACDIQSVTTFNLPLQRTKCEKFLIEYDSEALITHRNECLGLTSWYGELLREYQQDPDWKSKDEDVNAWLLYTQTNIELACSVEEGRNNFKSFFVALIDLDKIRQFVASRSATTGGVGGFVPIARPD